MDSNKRRFTRVNIHFPARFSLSNGSTYQISTFENLSIGGCLFQSPAAPAVGETCSIAIELDSTAMATMIEIEGVIVRTENNLTAVKFESIEPDSLFHLQNLIKYNAIDPETIEDEIAEHPGLR